MHLLCIVNNTAMPNTSGFEDAKLLHFILRMMILRQLFSCLIVTIMADQNIVDRLMIMYECDTQAKLAQKLNFTEACISTWRSSGNANLNTVIPQAVAMGINLNWLVTGIGEKKIAFGRRNKDDEANAAVTLAKREVERQKVQVEKLTDQNQKLFDIIVSLQDELKKKDKVIERKEKQIERLIEKIGEK